MSSRLIDTHIHIWNFERAEYAWLKNNSSILNRSYHIGELEAERKKAAVTDGLLVQAANNYEDTDWMLEIAGSTGWISGVVGWVPLMEPKETEKALTGKYLSNSYFKGVRHLIHDEVDPKWLLQENVIASLKILSALNLPYDVVGVSPAHIETALELANRVPALRMVFDHLNQPPIATMQNFSAWSDLMSEAARHPQFFVKISGLGTASKNFSGWTEEDIKPSIHFVIEHFGEERCFCGGDWPVSLLAGSYTSTWNAYKKVLTELLDEKGREKLFYKNALAFYKL